MKQQKKLYAGAMLAFCLAFSAKPLQAQTCIQPPSCESLGYTKTTSDCQGSLMVKCPTDTSKVYCADALQIVTVGAIVYGDGTVASGLVSGKTPIGVVFDTINRLAVSVGFADQNGNSSITPIMSVSSPYIMKWATELCDISGVENCDYGSYDSQILSCAPDGQANTKAILMASCGTTYAANAVNKYVPQKCTASFCQKGKWFLPSVSETKGWIENPTVVNTMNQLKKLGYAASFSDMPGYWTSTEGASGMVWAYDLSRSIFVPIVKNDISLPVRPVVKF